MATDWVPELTFAAKLALVRNRMGWNSKEAALACGLPATSWRNWEQGKRPHDYEKVCRAVAGRTGVSMHWLAFGSTSRPQVLDWSDLRSIAATGEQDGGLSMRRP